MTTAIATCALSIALPLLLIAAFTHLADLRDRRRAGGAEVWRGAEAYLAGLGRRR